MKRQTTTLFFSNLGKEEVERLTSIVTEVIAVPVKKIISKNFSAADLWNIQKQRRGFVQRRFCQ